MKKLLKFIIQGVLVVLVAGLGMKTYGYLVATKPEVRKKSKTTKVWPIYTQVLHLETHQPELKLFGEAVAGRQVSIRSYVAGEVIETGKALREGGIVKKDDVLLKIDPFTYRVALADAKAGLAEAHAKLAEIKANIDLETDSLKYGREQLALARKDYARAKKLVEKGSVSRKVADDRRLIRSQREQAQKRTQNNLKVQKARADQQKAAIERQSWRLKQAERNLRDSVLRAPFSAYVSQVTAQVGRTLNSNDAVAALIDRNWIEARFTLSDKQFGRIIGSVGQIEGRKVQVLWRVGDTPISYAAKIERVGAQISAGSGGVEVFARVKTPTKPTALRVGAFVEVVMMDRSFKNVVRLPQAAVYQGKHVYTVQNGRLVRHDIKLVGLTGEDMLIRGKSLKSGDRVMTTRLSVADNGIPVKIQSQESAVSGPEAATDKERPKKPEISKKTARSGAAQTRAEARALAKNETPAPPFALPEKKPGLKRAAQR